MCGDTSKVNPQFEPQVDLGLGLDPDAASRLLRALSDNPPPDPPAGAHPSPLTIQLPGYTIDRPLGAGGGGTVFRAFRHGSDRALALKVLRARADDPKSKRAWRELEMLDNLRLASLPRLIDYGTHDGHLYFAAEFIDGLTLEKHCRANQLDRRARVDLLARVADAVQRLHEHGVIHRDIKPSNIIVMPDGTPMLVDLGLAVHDASGSGGMTITAEGQPVGTPAFMAPEQARGERAKTSTRTDVYGLGATAYLVLTGKTPHDTETSLHEAVRRVAQDAARDARTLDATLPRALSAVLGKACAREAESRYASAAEFGQDLRRWLRGEGVMAGEMGVWGRCVRWVGRHPVITTGLACLLIILCSIGVTIVSVRLLWNAPASIKINESAQQVQLLSYATRVIHAWPYDAVQRSTPPFAVLVPRPPKLGGGQVALLKVRTSDPTDRFHFQLSVWDVSDLSVPSWATQGRDPTLVSPPPWHEDEDSYTVATELVADVFPGDESPGPEVVVVHQHAAYHPACIRVYNLAGSVLFEAWHKGSTGPVYWVPDPGLLVLRACCGYTSYEQLGIEGVPEQQKWPEVIFAIRPQRGQKLGWIRPWDPGAEPGAAWYLMLHPLEQANRFSFSALRMPDDVLRRTDCVDLSARLLGHDAALGLRIDAHGQPVGVPIVAGGLRTAFPEDPEHAVWLGPVPSLRATPTK